MVDTKGLNSNQYNLKKYALRLFFLALPSHFAYAFCFGIPFIPFKTTAFNQTSVAWSLAWGLMLLYIGVFFTIINYIYLSFMQIHTHFYFNYIIYYGLLIFCCQNVTTFEFPLGS